MIGMNVTEVERLGKELKDVYAADVARFVGQIDKLIGATSSSWVGRDANEFRSWWPNKRARLVSMANDLRDYGDVALKNAGEQIAASGGSGGQLVGSQGIPKSSIAPTLRDIIRLTPAEQAVAWEQLSKAEQNSLLRGHEAHIGELPFIAPEIRYAANYHLIFDQWSRLNADQAKANGLSGSDALRLGVYDRILREHKNVLFFDPGGDGRIAVVEGNLATAKHIAVTVPGISNNLDNFGDYIDTGVHLKGVTGPDTAVVTWLGYDTPVGIGLNPARMAAEIGNKTLAAAGATALVPFVGGLRELNPSASMTVIGHSYGSLVTGLAAKNGLRADNVVFIGSPGVGVNSTADFNLPDGAKVYAMEPGAAVHLGSVGAGGDPVSNLGHNVHPLGGVPTEPGFGATTVDIGNRLDVTSSHGAYYDVGSKSLNNLGSIVDGNGPL